MNTTTGRGDFYGGLFLVTAGTLMLQIIQTRILSVVTWYHLAFFAISMAMFGLTAGAVWVYLRRKRFSEATLSRDLTGFGLAFALATALGLGVQMTLAPVLSWSFSSLVTWVELALCLAVPFFFSGIVVSLALTRSPFPIGLVYGADLLGAAAGCLAALWLLQLVDGPSAILWTAALSAGGALLFAQSGIGRPLTPDTFLIRRRKLILVCLVVAAALNGLSDYGLQPLVVKGRFEDGSSHVYRKWNSFSRVAVYPNRLAPPHMWGASPLMPRDLLIEQLYLNIDGDAGTTAYRFSGDLKELAFLQYDITSLAYQLPGRRRAGVIGVGGGRDLLTAAWFGMTEITGVELNPTFVDLLTRLPGFREYTNVGALPGVHLLVDDGRSWFARSAERFDLIQMSLVDTWAATGAGAFSLSENGLYTLEAWRIFLDRLTPRGIFTVSRWYAPDDVTETGRLLSLAVAALQARGVEQPREHIFMASQGSIATLLVSPSPFSNADLEILRDRSRALQHQILLSPWQPPESDVLRAILSAATPQELARAVAGSDFDLSAPTDNRPFFFNQLPLNRPLQAFGYAFRAIKDAGAGGIRTGNLLATATLFVLFVVATGLVIGAIVLPLRAAVEDVGAEFARNGTIYFLLIGIGFMLVEIGLLQRMSVLLGHPTYALSIVLFTLILSTGAGAFASHGLPLDSFAKFCVWAALSCGYLLLLPWLLPQLIGAFEGAALPVRASLCVATIAPAGLLLGYAFPTGMRLIENIDRRPMPWFWGINGGAGVLASIAAVAISISFGIGATLTIGGLCYLLLIAPAVKLFPRAPR